MPATVARHARWLIALALLAAAFSAGAQPEDSDLLRQLDGLQTIPVPGPMTIRPRIYAAYGALIAAAMLSVLYLYRGRAFIVYWIGAWLLLAASLALVARGYPDPLPGSVLAGLALLFVVWSAGLMLLAAVAFPQNPLQWSAPVRAAAASAVWFLLAPFVFPLMVVIGSGTAAGSGLLGWAALRYLQLARASRHAGAILIGIGLTVIGIGNAVGGIVALATSEATGIGRLGAINVITTMFVALGMHLLVFEDMTDELRVTNRNLASANDDVKRLAITDPLTGCHNRRFFDEIERREMQRHRRYQDPLTVLFVDVNHFKRLNDTLGHDRGDETLRAIGALLRRQVRESDYVIRWGGDEFLLLLSCTERDAQAKAAELKAAFGQERIRAALPADVGLSIGVAAVSKQASSLRDAIRDADAAMYRDKPAERSPQ